jgi:hypothetical protein
MNQEIKLLLNVLIITFGKRKLEDKIIGTKRYQILVELNLYLSVNIMSIIYFASSNLSFAIKKKN